MRKATPILVIAFLGLASVAFLVARPETGADPEHDPSVAQVWNSMLDEVPFDAFEQVESGPLEFPRDHGAHSNVPMETWNLSAHLHDESGQPLGVQFSVTRLTLVAPDAEPADSEWDMREFYRGHAILADGKGASAEERLRRGFAGLAGYDAQAREWRLDNWSMTVEDGSIGPTLLFGATVDEDAALELRLEPLKEAISPDVNGPAGPFRGYAMTRLKAAGVLATKDGSKAVEGFAWLDHAWGDLPLPTGPTVWDRLLLHAKDGSDISLIRTRRRDGVGTPTVEGFVVGPAGNVSQVEGPAVRMEPLRTWSRDGASSSHPVSWRLSLGGDREMVVSPLVEDQLHDFVIPVWSGAVTARGDLGSGPVEAVGTLQLNGYSDP